MLGRTEKESRLQLLERITMERSTKKVTFEQRLEEGERGGHMGEEVKRERKKEED